MIRINADDFGYSKVDNMSILYCFQKKIINSSTIMVNAPMFLEAVELSKKAGIDRMIGLHLNLTEFIPLTEEIKTNTKFVKNGTFYNNIKNRGIFSFISFSCKDKKQIKKEIEAQIILFRKYYPNSNFLDSHHHIHTVYPILKIVLKLARKYGFTVLRISKNVPKTKSIKTIYKSIINKRIIKQFDQSSSYFSDTSVDSLDRLNLLGKKDRNIEIMVHPIAKNDECVDKFTEFDLSKLPKVFSK